MQISCQVVHCARHVIHHVTATPLSPHPLHHLDRPIVDRLLQSIVPSEQDIADCARLMNRYQGFLGDPSTWRDLCFALKRWNLTRDELNTRARTAWQSGWRPMDTSAQDAVGSGADVNG